MSKHIVADVEYVECPYCPEGPKNRFKILHWKHLKSLHKKTLKDVLQEFPNLPTMTLAEFEKKCTTSKMGTQASKQTSHNIKTIYCIYCKEKMEVRNNESNIQACKKCLNKGLENPDGRTKKQANVKRVETIQGKWGKNVTNIQHIPGVTEQMIHTQVEKYGGIGFASKELGKKSKDKIKEKFGGENIMKTNHGKQFFIGDKNPMRRSPEARMKVSNKMKGRESPLKGKSYEEIYGEEKAELLKKTRSDYFTKLFLPKMGKFLEYNHLKLIDSEYLGAHIKHKWKCIICNTTFEQIYNALQQGFQCPKCYPRNQGYSKGEKELLEFIREFVSNDKIIENDKKLIKPKELDIFIPSKNLAFEYNGLYRHTDEFMDPKYHLNKTNECLQKGIKLIHIFEDEWIYKNDIVKERVKKILGVQDTIKIYARRCEVREVESKLKNEFLEKFHIQGPDLSTIKLGAFYNNELVSIMTFSYGNPSKGSRKKEGVWELNRFCSNYKYHIQGIAGKLLEHFKRNYKWKEIFSYADRRWSSGDLYYKLGFQTDSILRLNYWYCKGLKRIHRFALRKKPNEPKDITEKNLRITEGYTIVWDCGNLKFTLRNE